MKINSMEISDFFRQLALLTRSGLPLPETLRQLAATSGRKDIKTMIEECANAVGDGNKLSDAMKKYADELPPFYLRMITMGEREGALPEILAELAQIARMRHLLATMIKDIILYPFITISLAFLIFLVMAVWVIPEFHKIFIELLEGEPLPGLTAFVIVMFTFIKDYISVFVALYLAYLAVMIWFFIDKRTADRMTVRLVRSFPFSEVIFYNHAMARMCTMWASMIRRRIPAEEAFPAIAEIMDFPQVSQALNRVAANCRNGSLFNEALEREPDISRLLLMTVKNTREEMMPEQLDRLAELFLERASYGFRRAGVAWELISIGAMVLIIGGIIFLLFLPFMGQLFFR